MEINATFWDSIKARMKSRNENNKLLVTWLDPIEYLESAENGGRRKFQLGVPNILHQYWIIQNLQEKILSEISETYKDPFEVEFVVTGHKAPVPPRTPRTLLCSTRSKGSL